MSVLVKGMKMPTNCTDCPCSFNLFYCRAADDMLPVNISQQDDKIVVAKPKWCPLVELPESYMEGEG